MLVIDPKKNTASEPGKLNPHSGEIWQCIVHRGYADRTDGESSSADKTLMYVYRGLDGQDREELFCEGDIFASTLTDDGKVHGYWHCNTNVSDRPIILEVSRKLEKKS